MAHTNGVLRPYLRRAVLEALQTALVAPARLVAAPHPSLLPETGRHGDEGTSPFFYRFTSRVKNLPTARGGRGRCIAG